MFENFTFGAVSLTQHDEVHASPTDMSFPAPQTSFPFCHDTFEDLSGIVQQFSKQTLDRNERVKEYAPWQEAIDKPLEVDSDEEMSCLQSTRSVPSQPYSSTPSGSIACRRLQRQLNTQLQLSTSHMRDISTLVEDMIATNSQCRLQQRSSRTHLPSPVSPVSKMLAVDSDLEPGEISVDEGFCEPELNVEEEMSLRRASNPSGIRKYGVIKYGRSADYVCVGGRMKVRSKPRMRKRAAVS